MADESNSDKPGLHIDADWKAQARAEKQRLAEQAKQQAAATSQATADAGASTGAAAAAQAGPTAQASGGQRELPPADFKTMVSQMVTQAMFALGMIADPQTGRRVAMVDLARYHIDMLGVLEAKTEGNLDDEEKKLLATALYELRMNYVQVSQQAIEQQTGGGQGGA